MLPAKQSETKDRHLNLSDTLRSFRVTHYVILNAISYALYELNDGKWTVLFTHP